MGNFKDRVIRAAKLDVSLYEEVEKDRESLGQAMGVVVLSSIAAGIGMIPSGGSEGIGGIGMITILSLIGWYVWAYVIYFVGTKILPEPQTKSDPGEVLRTIGFSSSPGILRILGIIPAISSGLYIITSVWMLIAMVIAVRQALDYKSTARAIGVCLLGWVIQAIIMGIFLLLAGGPVAEI